MLIEGKEHSAVKPIARHCSRPGLYGLPAPAEGLGATGRKEGRHLKMDNLGEENRRQIRKNC